MHFMEIDGRRYAQFEQMRQFPGLTHAISTRPQDVSIRNGGRRDECAERRRRMAIDFRRDPDQLYCCRQIHTPRIEVLEQAVGSRVLEGSDGVVTALPAVSLLTFSADCPLILVFDPIRRVVGLAHASWRCTVARIVTELVDLMKARFGSAPSELHAGIGPSAGPKNYEVKDDVYRAAADLPERDRFFIKRDGRMYFDLWRANRSQLELAGIPAAQIELAEICTMSRTDLFYSYRREGVGCGHFCLMAGLVQTDRAKT